MLYTLNTLAWSHPYALFALVLALYALCWVPLLTQRRTHTPDPAFLASFATPPTGNVRIVRATPQYATPQALVDACAEAVTWAQADEVENALASLADECENDLRHLAHKIEHFAQTVEFYANAPAQSAQVTVQHFASSTERMRAQRAAYAAQGLTARGTQPLPTCTGTTRKGEPCKRKANTGMAVCTAHTDALV